MKMAGTKIIMQVLFLCFVTLTLSCSTNKSSVVNDNLERPLTQAEFQALWSELELVMKEFASATNAGQIPGITSNEKGWKTEFFKITPLYLLKSQDIDAKQFATEIKECPDLFKVDAKKELPSQQLVRCFYCKRNSKIELLSVYSFQDGKWLKTR